MRITECRVPATRIVGVPSPITLTISTPRERLRAPGHFRFESLPQLERAIAYYERKILPSSIIPKEKFHDYGGFSGEAHRWYERLPLFLREEPKRRKVVKALRAARTYFDGTK